MNSDAFYLPDNERGSVKNTRIAAAKSLCRSCPVQRQCLNWALDTDEPYGVWGGTTPEERKQIQAKLASLGDGRRTA